MEGGDTRRQLSRLGQARPFATVSGDARRFCRIPLHWQVRQIGHWAGVQAYGTLQLWFAKKQNAPPQTVVQKKYDIYIDSIHQLKYKGRFEVGYHLGYLYGQEIKSAILEIKPDFITTVPLHSQKIKERGYNQSDEIAKGFSNATNIPFIPNLINRIEATETQTKKRRYTRWENIENKFVLDSSIEIHNKHIVLIDDVITTGATMEACGKVILENKYTNLSILSICYAIS